MEFLIKLISYGILSIILTTTAYASNFSFLNYSPVAYFTDQDWKIFKQTATKALDSSKDDIKFSWSNPKSGASGYVIPTRTASNNKMTCRDLIIFNIASDRRGKATYQFCKIAGKWKVTA